VREDITWVGIDDHKNHLQVSVLRGDEPESAIKQARIVTDRQAVRRWIRKLRREARGPVLGVYEAGPLGFTLQRWIEAAGGACEVAAPSRTPRAQGERVKTDRRDSRKLAMLYRSGMLRMVHPPSPEQEARRDLARQRNQAGEDLRRSMQRINKFLLRRGLIWRKTNWTQEFLRWLRGLRFEDELTGQILHEYLVQYEERRERVAHLDRLIEEAAKKEAVREQIGWLRCFRGIDTLTAFTIVTTLHSPERFRSAEELMSFVGLTGSESSTGERRNQGPITKQGDKLVRRLLIEAAKQQRRRVRVSAPMRRRREGQPEWVITLANTAMKRLHRKYWSMVFGHKHPNVAAAAVARELVGFIWSVFQRSATVQLDKAS
jgi:transposase